MDRFKRVKVASILGILGNIFLLIIKSIIGFITKSSAMIADAVNSAGDILSSLITFIGNQIASKPSDECHNLGHGKAEYIYSMLISIIMIFLSLSLLKKSIASFTAKTNAHFSLWLIVICMTNIVIKFALYLYTNKIAKEENNLLIKANSKDHLCDTIISIFTLVSCILIYREIYLLDAIVSMGISIYIVITAIKIFIESYDVLMDKSISEETKEKVYALIKKHPEVIKINHFNSTPVGYRYQISFTIFVDGSLSTFESHHIADHLEKEIKEKIEEIYLTVIHVNPIEIKKTKKPPCKNQ